MENLTQNKDLSFADLKYGDRFIILNDGWSKDVFVFGVQRQHPKNDRLTYYSAEGNHTINIPGSVQWKLKLKKVSEN